MVFLALRCRLQPGAVAELQLRFGGRAGGSALWRGLDTVSGAQISRW